MPGTDHLHRWFSLACLYYLLPVSLSRSLVLPRPTFLSGFHCGLFIPVFDLDCSPCLILCCLPWFLACFLDCVCLLPALIHACYLIPIVCCLPWLLPVPVSAFVFSFYCAAYYCCNKDCKSILTLQTHYYTATVSWRFFDSIIQSY